MPLPEIEGEVIMQITMNKPIGLSALSPKPQQANVLQKKHLGTPQPNLYQSGHSRSSQMRFAGKLHENINRPEELERLLTRQTEDVNGTDPSTGDTALHRLLKKENPNLQSLKLLIEADADVNVKNKRGETPLHCLLDHESPSLRALDLLLSAGAKVNKRDRAGYTPLHTYAVYPQHNAEVFERLLKAGADANAPNSDGLSPLHRVLAQDDPDAEPNLETAKVLLQGGAKIKHSKDGKFLLMTALKQRDAGLLLLLLTNGFKLHKKDKPKHCLPERLLGDSTNYNLVQRFLGKRTNAFILKVLAKEVEPDMEVILEHTGQVGRPYKMAEEVARTAFDVFS